MKDLGALLPGIKYSHRVFPQNLLDGGGGAPMVKKDGNYWFVDGDVDGDGAGQSWSDAFKFIASAISAASAGDVIYIAERTITDLATDPISYEENLTIPNNKPHLSLIGVSRGLTQGGLPQLKDGSATTQAILRIRAPGCLIANLGFNGSGNTGGGILLEDDGGSSTVSFGTTITGCHFKNCKGSTATDSRTGGAIMWTSDGGAWQTRISGNTFYKNVGDIILKGTSSSKPQDVIIDYNYFSGLAASTDCNIYGAGGSGFAYVYINNNVFGQVPALGSGSIVLYMDLTGSTGMVTNNVFGALTANTGTTITFKATGSGAKIPTTVHMAGNYGQSDTVTESGEITIA